MLATNFNKDKQVSFSSSMIKETINSENSENILVIKIKNGNVTKLMIKNFIRRD